MEKTMLIGLAFGGLAVASAGALAGYKAIEDRHSAEVLSVQALTHTVKLPRQVCSDQTVVRQVPTQDPNRVTGSVVGALLGGVLGNHIGKGTGRTVATVAGAAAGGYAGNQVQKGMQQGDTYQAVEKRCSTVYDTVEQSDGYEVHYRLGEQQGILHMDHDPGPRIPVKDGELVLASTDGSRQRASDAS